MKKIMAIFACIFVTLSYIGFVQSIEVLGTNTYYISKSGNDSNPGSFNAPYKTINQGLTVAKPGDTIYVRGGIYYESINFLSSGNEKEGYITLRNYKGETPILDGTRLLEEEVCELVNITNQNYIQLIGFEICNLGAKDPENMPIGIYVSGSSHHIRLKGNRIHNIEVNYKQTSEGCANGIGIYGTDSSHAIHDLWIEENEVYDCKLGWSESITLNGNVEDFFVTKNDVHHNDNIGIDFIGFEGTASVNDQARNGICSKNKVSYINTKNNPAYEGGECAAGIYVDGGANIDIYHNIVKNCDFGIEASSEHAEKSASNITIHYNMIMNNLGSGILLGGYDEQRGYTTNSLVKGNLLYHNNQGKDNMGEILLQYDTRENTITRNFIYANNKNTFLLNPYQKNRLNIVDYNVYISAKDSSECYWEWQKEIYTDFKTYQKSTGNDAHSSFKSNN